MKSTARGLESNSKVAKPMRIDAHTHLGECDRTYYGQAKNWDMSGYFTAADLIALLDEVEVDAALCFPLGTRASDAGLRLVIEGVQKYPDRLRGFYWGNPHDPAAPGELEKCVREYGLSGLKLHPTSDSWMAGHPMADPLMHKAEELGVPVTIHSHQPGSQPALIGELATRFPKVTVIMAHMGMHHYRDAMYVASKEPNVVLETAVQPWAHRMARDVVDRIGLDRLVWGSDAPLHHPTVEKAKIEVSALTDAERDAVMGGNIARILNWT